MLLHLPGRGRVNNRHRPADYNSLADARDVASIMAALELEQAVVLDQGQGGQVAMALATAHPLLVADTVLLDAGPVTDSRGILCGYATILHMLRRCTAAGPLQPDFAES
ncbi:MAG: alpha/beta hydrolase [Candidatus Devosia symbiotica]|nr:alpha/beta hydrolase [Candidatus Devosia symbiotica]